MLSEPMPGKFVMVVDDDADIRESLERVLEIHGHRVATAAGGHEAMDVLRGTPTRPCVILLDLMMPGMNGFEVQAELQSDPAWSAIPIVIITGATMLAEQKARTLRLEVLRKPFDLKILLATIDRFCASPPPQ